MKTTCKQVYEEVQLRISHKLLFGADEILRLAIITFLAKGHLLIEGPPGTGKTLTAHLLARVFGKNFKRIQFTSDMLPADVLGSHIFNPAAQEFKFIQGPIFSEIILADEINRTPPRTQSALLEAMEERQVTIEGETFALNDEFFVVATQNPREFDGTFPLPEAQLDRFMLKINVSHQEEGSETLMLRESLAGTLPPDFSKIEPLTIEREALQTELQKVNIDQSILEYISRIVAKTRTHPMLRWGSSFRGSLAIARCSRVAAAIAGRDHVIPDDVNSLVKHALQHRIRLTPEAEIGQQSVQEILEGMLESTAFPL
jgi:MoxR-like ATPase